MDRPKPQPGHQLNPRLSSGHKLECPEPCVVTARKIKAKAQAINSKGKNDRNCKIGNFFIKALYSSVNLLNDKE